MVPYKKIKVQYSISRDGGAVLPSQKKSLWYYIGKGVHVLCQINCNFTPENVKFSHFFGVMSMFSLNWGKISA